MAQRINDSADTMWRPSKKYYFVKVPTDNAGQ